ncbi:MAG: hypothetical protein WCH79_07110 [Planctomycetia bacterium]
MRAPIPTPVPPARGRIRRLRPLLTFLSIWWGLSGGGTLARAAEPTSLRIESTDNGVSSGTLVALDGAGLKIDVAGQQRVVPIDTLRLVERQGEVGRGVGRCRIGLVDGSWIEAGEIAWEGSVVILTRPDGRGEIPVAKVRSVAWRQADDDATAVPGAAWLVALPETIESDLLVVGSASGHEFVECAIKAIGPDTITVVLDEETIPVKRSKVIGIHWLRGEPTAPKGGTGKSAAAVAVDLVGGALRARRIEWTPEKLLLDGDVSLPGDAVVRLDWAAGRTMSLVGVAPERLEVEPWFGDLGRIPGLASFFAPRSVVAEGGVPRPGLVIRPRTAAVWRLPPEARRFRTSIAPAGGARAAGISEVIVTVDDREVFRRQIDASAVDPGAEGIPIEVDVAGGRRLGVTVGFVSASDSGCPVRFTSPAVEQ